MESIITALLSPLKNLVAWTYHVLAFIQFKRFEKSGRREDLEKSITHNRTALSFRPREGRGRSVSLLNLALCLWERHNRWGQSEDLEKAIELGRTALELRPRDHPNRIKYLNNLAISLEARYKEHGRTEDLDEITELLRAALKLRREGHPDRSLSYSGLARSLTIRYERCGRIEDLEEAIQLHRAALELCPEGHPNRSISLNNFAISLHVRYEQQGRPEDLESVIMMHQAALKLRPEGHPYHSMSLNNLANSLWTQYKQYGSGEDLEAAIEMHRAALNLYRKGHPDRSASLNNLADCLRARFEQHGTAEDLEEAIQLHWSALRLLSEGHPHRCTSLNNLALSLLVQYNQYGRAGDLEDSVKMYQSALKLCPKGHPFRSKTLSNLAITLRTRYHQHGRTEDLEEAIELHQASLELLPEGHTDYYMSLNFLASSLTTRYKQHGRTKDLEEAIELHQSALKLCPESHPYRYVSLNSLATSLWMQYERDGRTEDLEESIELNRSALELCPKGHPSHSSSLSCLATSLRVRYKQHGRTVDIEEAIELHRAALELRPEGHPDRFSSLRNLAIALEFRIKKHWNTEEFDECIQLLELATIDKFSGLLERLPAAQRWVTLARLHNHDTIFAAYKAVLSILQHALTINPTLHAQHDFLLKNSDYTVLSLDAASYAIEKNQLEQAVEILEQGRGLLWSHLRGLRPPLDQLAETNNELVDRFRNVSRRLEKLAIAHEPLTSTATMYRDGSLGLDVTRERESFDELLKLKRKLSSEREEVIGEIRRVPGFESFLEATPFKVLRQAALEGPVIMINHSKFRSDALIILSRGGPSVICIPLDSEFHSDSLGLSQELVVTREWLSADSSHYDEKLRKATKMLWDRAVSKVVVELEKVGIAKGSRIWWCPTSELSALPFHAAGPFEGASGAAKYLLDDYVSSYTPTLEALISARSGGNEDDPTVLVIGDTSLRSTRQEISNIRNCGINTNLLIDKKASRDRVIKAIREATWVHFACHGQLGSSPFNSSFKLSDRGMTLLDIVQNRLPNAEFAFLSACHTAEQHHGSAYDETLHLAAAMQFSGFRSVIGSMWELLDKDGPALTKAVYEYINDCEEGEVKYKRAAGGLCKAVLELKSRDGIQIERWVNLVHIGA